MMADDNPRDDDSAGRAVLQSLFDNDLDSDDNFDDNNHKIKILHHHQEETPSLHCLYHHQHCSSTHLCSYLICKHWQAGIVILSLLFALQICLTDDVGDALQQYPHLCGLLLIQAHQLGQGRYWYAGGGHGLVDNKRKGTEAK
jgi:hypothetical protein